MEHPYGIEVGDVLLSVQVLLATEAHRSQPSDHRSPIVPIGSARRSREVRDAMAAHPSVPRLGQAPPPTDLGLIDPSTGAGTMKALRRDLQAELAYGPSGRGKPSLEAIRIERDPTAASSRDDVMRALVEVVPFMVRGRDRVYRTGPNEVALLMPSTDEDGADVALDRLLEGVPKALAERKLGSVRLAPRRIEAPRHGAAAAATT
jgi:hypothetical protein